MQWLQKIRSAVASQSYVDLDSSAIATSEKETLEHLTDIMVSRKPAEAVMDSIPVFFKKKPEPGSLIARVRKLAKIKFLEKQSNLILTPNDLELIWKLLREHRVTSSGKLTERIDYSGFCKVGSACEDKIGEGVCRFFTAATFLTFESDESGCIDVSTFYLYVLRWATIMHSRINMMLLDSDGDDHLFVQEIEGFLRKMVPEMEQLKGIDAHFLPLYCQIAARKFMFFTDPQRKGKAPIPELVLSKTFSEFMELKEPLRQSEESDGRDNWFSLENTQRVYYYFLSLDKDHNGTLSKEELMAFDEYQFTDIFIERVFDVHLRLKKGEVKNGGEMDMVNFLDMVIALENSHTREGLLYIFRCIDLSSRGFLTIADVYTNIRCVAKKWVERGNYEISIENLKEEIWDMVQPKNALYISFEDLCQCGQGHSVVASLINVDGLWGLENRDALAAKTLLDEEAEI